MQRHFRPFDLGCKKNLCSIRFQTDDTSFALPKFIQPLSQDAIIDLKVSWSAGNTVKVNSKRLSFFQYGFGAENSFIEKPSNDSVITNEIALGKPTFASTSPFQMVRISQTCLSCRFSMTTYRSRDRRQKCCEYHSRRPNSR